MSSPLSVRRRSGAALLATALAALVCLPGCDEKYSEKRVYPIRTDPVITDPLKFTLANAKLDLPEGIHDPDPPGQLPLFNLRGLKDARNPLHKNREDLGELLFDPTTISDEDRQDLREILEEAFGIPADPAVPVSPDQSQKLMLSRNRLNEGSRLYRLHCLQCHGLTGDGRGPTSRWVNPHPRDYRQGLFKFMSADQREGIRPPRREDLIRTLRYGIEGTAMPTFNVLPDDELESLTSYVIHLSIRGQAEYEALKYRATTGKEKKDNLSDRLLGSGRTSIRGIVRQWAEAQDKPIDVPEPKTLTKDEMTKSVQRGHVLFKAQCATCHVDYGRKALFKLDQWGTLTRPRNLAEAIYRGGRRPLDIYYRVHSGISGSGMTPFGRSEDGSTGLAPEQLWDLVHFVRALPYKPMRKEYGINLP
ncbi:MAG: cytochrome c [Gemmataceae bacterium]|nr:cytochrome c [Gemmataceae bacterium]